MARKAIAFTVIVSMAVLNIFSFACAQQDFEALIEEGIRAQKAREAKEAEISQEEIAGIKTEWRTFECPSCLKEFQMPVSEIAIEALSGRKEITCPYDGVSFILDEFKDVSSFAGESDYADLVSPYTDEKFRARLSTEDITSGALITDPISGKKFRYVAQQVKPWQEWKLVVNPDDGSKFRIRLFDGRQPRELTSPYDASRFSTDFEYGKKPQPLSNIEQMFSREIPITATRNIRQFGYDLFPKVSLIQKLGEEREDDFRRDSRIAGGTLQQNRMLDSRQEGLGRGRRPSAAEFFEEGIQETLTSIPVSDDYVLGPGDKLIVDLWGNIQQKFDLDIDGEGKVMLPKAGPLYLWGTEFGRAKEVIESQLSKHFSNFQINVSMSKLRSIKVFILGEANRPGAYTVSSLSTVFSALYKAGGPKKSGSLRKVKLIRANNTQEEIDLYAYLLKGDRSRDFKLDAGDTIFIPPIGGVVGVAGNVKRPAIFELNSKVPLGEILFDMAGGASAIGYLQRIQVERIEDHQRKIVLDLELNSMEDFKASTGDIMLQDGDLLLISAIAPIRHNFVTVFGNIQRPGDYELKPGMKLKELLKEAGGILPGTYLERAELSRFRDDKTREIIPVNLRGLLDSVKEENILLEEWDRLRVFVRSEVVPTFYIKIEGAVYRPGEYELTENMRISDLIFRGGGLKKTASLKNAELYRMNLGEEPKVIKIDLSAIFDPRTKEHDLFLREGDQLFIREEAKWLTKRKIELSGEVLYPGTYIATPGERLSSIIKRAGGFTDRAFLQGAIFTRRSVGLRQQKVIKEFINSEQERLWKEAMSLAVDVKKDIREEMVKYHQKQIEALQDNMYMGRIVVKLKPLSAFEGSENDILLENEDSLYIPLIPSSVQMVGSVHMPNAITYKAGMGMDYYISKAGGLTKDADKKGIFVIKASGEAIRRFSTVSKIERGDTIIIPERFKYKVPTGFLLKDAFSLASQLIVTIVAVSAVN